MYLVDREPFKFCKLQPNGQSTFGQLGNKLRLLTAQELSW